MRLTDGDLGEGDGHDRDPSDLVWSIQDTPKVLSGAIRARAMPGGGVGRAGVGGDPVGVCLLCAERSVRSYKVQSAKKSNIVRHRGCMARIVLVTTLVVGAFGDFAQRPSNLPPYIAHAHRRENAPSLLSLRGGHAIQEIVEEVTTPAHALVVRDFLAREGVSTTQGLSKTRADQLLSQHGPNSLAIESTESLWKLFLAQFNDRLVQILMCVAVMSYALAYVEGDANGWVEPAVILGILLLNAVVGTWQECSAQSALDSLQKLQPTQARCLRDGTWMHNIAAAELVPGDVIELRVGDRVPADARLVSLSTTTLSADEGSLTGESATVGKELAPVASDARIQEKKNLLFSGTVITNGKGIAIITATGQRTEMGKIQQGVHEAKQKAECGRMSASSGKVP